MFHPTVSEPNAVIYQAMTFLEQEPHAQLGAEQKMCFLFLTGAALKKKPITIKALASQLSCTPKAAAQYVNQIQKLNLMDFTVHDKVVSFTQHHVV